MDKDLRRLVFTGLSLVVVLIVGRIVIGSIWDDGEMRRSVNKLASSARSASRPDRGAMTATARLVTDLEDQLAEVVPRLGHEIPPEFAVPSDASADLRYIEVLRREQEALVHAARFIGKSVPLDLGMPVPNPTGLEDVIAALRALHVVHVVVSAGLAADIDSVDGIRVPPVPRRRSADGGFVKLHKVEFDVVGSPGAIRDMLAAVVGGDPYFALDDVRIESLDEDGESVRCRMTVAAVAVDTEQTMLAERS